MTQATQPGAYQDDARREEDGVIDQRAQQIDPAGRHRVDRNAVESTPPEPVEDPAPTDPDLPSAPVEDPPATPEVRNAGPQEMNMPPRQWTKTDEENDESFPASDPPGNY